MEKLPEYLDVATSAQQLSLKSKVRELADAYMGMQKRSSCYVPPANWTGSIDYHLAKFLSSAGTFINWFIDHNPSRRQEIRNALDGLAGPGRALPNPLATMNVKTWESIRDFFQATSHHRKSTDELEFSQRLNALEQFLLDKLAPRTFDDFSEIDALLENEEGHA
jgi:hypothetical protein